MEDPFSVLNVDKKYVINLDHRTDRKAHAIKQLESIGVSDYIIFPGLNTKTLKIIAQHLDKPGTVGCYLSHQFLIHEAYANDYNAILIMEDDLQFVPDFAAKFEEQCKNLPQDWDMLWVGSHVVKKGTQVKGEVFSGGQLWGFQCYILSRTGIQKLYGNLNSRVIRNHIDIQVSNMKDIKQYYFFPSMCNQANMGSDNGMWVQDKPGFINRKLPKGAQRVM
jgi:GR25 family glycosyltransferase involved in LPS biosynthesis